MGKQAGLYKENTNEIIYSWQEMIEKGYLSTEKSIAVFSEKYMQEYHGDIVISDGIKDLKVVNYNDNIDASKISFNKVVIPKSFSDISVSFKYFLCSKVKHLEVDCENEYLYSKNDCIIDRKKRLIVGCVNSKIPTDGSVEIIGDSAFACLQPCETIVIPDSVKVIEAYAFDEANLTEVVIPDSVVSIGKDAFRINALKKLTIGCGIKEFTPDIFTGSIEELHFSSDNWYKCYSVCVYEQRFGRDNSGYPCEELYCADSKNKYEFLNTDDDKLNALDFSQCRKQYNDYRTGDKIRFVKYVRFPQGEIPQDEC